MGQVLREVSGACSEGVAGVRGGAHLSVCVQYGSVSPPANDLQEFERGVEAMYQQSHFNEALWRLLVDASRAIIPTEIRRNLDTAANILKMLMTALSNEVSNDSIAALHAERDKMKALVSELNGQMLKLVKEKFEALSKELHTLLPTVLTGMDADDLDEELKVEMEALRETYIGGELAKGGDMKAITIDFQSAKVRGGWCVEFWFHMR